MKLKIEKEFRGFYPASVALLLIFGMVTLIWSQFYPYILQKYSLKELSPVVISASFIGFGMLIFQLISGFLADKRGPKLTMTFSSLLYFLGMFIISVMFNFEEWEIARLYWYTGSFFVGAGAGLFVGTYPVVISRWYPENTGKAFGIAIFGQNISPLIMSPLVAFLISKYGIQETYIAIGLLVAVSFFTVGTILWKIPEVKSKNEQSLKSATKDGRFWILFTVMFSTATAWFLILMNIATIVSEGLTRASISLEYISAQFIPLFLGLTAVGSALGSLFWGNFNDRNGGPLNTLPILYAMAGVAIAIFAAFYSDLWLILVVGIFMYFCLGGEPTVHFTAVPTFFGQKFTGRITAMMNISVMVSSILGPYLGAAIRDLTSSYISALYLASLLHFFAAAVVFLGRKYVKEVKEC
ncbi:MAG: MFS transporter [Archaeoglobales archaeon]|nr:MFS transporter [Archaeoglobales archaeon]